MIPKRLNRKYAYVDVTIANIAISVNGQTTMISSYSIEPTNLLMRKLLCMTFWLGYRIKACEFPCHTMKTLSVLP